MVGQLYLWSRRHLDVSRRVIATVVAECVLHILRHPDKGMTNGDPATWSARYRELDAEVREWVLVELVKMRELAVVFGRYGAPKFYGRTHAWEDAFSCTRKQFQAEAITRALRLT